jgi:hypothetical protein
MKGMMKGDVRPSRLADGSHLRMRSLESPHNLLILRSGEAASRRTHKAIAP